MTETWRSPDCPSHLEPGRRSSLAALVATHRSSGERRAPLAGAGQLPRGRPRPLLPRAGRVHPGGQGRVPGLRGAGSTASSTRSPTARSSGSGAASRSVSAGGSAASVRSSAASADRRLSRTVSHARRQKRCHYGSVVDAGADAAGWRGAPRSSGWEPSPTSSRNSTSQRASSAAGTQPDQLDARDVARRPRARGRAPRCTPLARPVRSRSTRFIDTCARSRDASAQPERAHAGEPAVALADRRRRSRGRARGRRGRARSSPPPAPDARPPRSRPTSGCGARRRRGRARASVNASRRSVGQGALLGRRRRRRGTPGTRARVPPTRRRLARRVAATTGVVPSSATNGTTSSAPMRGMHAVVARQVDVLGHRARQRTDRELGVAAAGPGEGEHRAVVVGVDVHVEQRRPARGRERVDARVTVATLRHVRHALEHASAGYGGTDRLRLACVLGLALPQFDYSVAGDSPLSWATVAEYAIGAEAAGYDSLWLSDHLFLDLDKYGGPAGPFAGVRADRRRSARSPASPDAPGSARSWCARRCVRPRCSPRRSRRST